MQHFFYYWGPLVQKTTIDQSFYDMLTTAKQNAIDSDVKFQHNLLNLSKEVIFTDDDLTVLLEHLTPHVAQYVSTYYNQWTSKQPPRFSLSLQQAWFNFNCNTDLREPHAHYNSDLSFVIYYDVPSEIKAEADQAIGVTKPGSIKFINQVGFPSNTKFAPIQELELFPDNMDLLIFPSYLMHWVVPHSSDVTRISVSGNIYLNDE